MKNRHKLFIIIKCSLVLFTWAGVQILEFVLQYIFEHVQDKVHLHAWHGGLTFPDTR